MPTIRLPQGTYNGGSARFANSDQPGVNYYHGIPYAQPFRRFQRPQPALPSDDVRDATRFGPICPQPPSKLEPYIYGPWPKPPDGGAVDESGCGVLSVYQPESVAADDAELLPVIVYAHGGAWQTGSSQINWYTGTALARDGKCIVVTINYRVGILGFLHQAQDDSSDQALGIQDHILALTWTHQNIRVFNGDPTNITAAGQSAGAYNTQLLLDLCPDLMRRAIIMSPPADRAFSAEDTGKVAQTVRESLPEGKTLESASAEEIIAAQMKGSEAHAGLGSQFGPVISDGVAPGGRHKIVDEEEKKDVLVTWTQHDGSAFAALAKGPSATMTDELSVQITDGLFKGPSIRLAARLKEAGHTVTTLEHQWAPEGFGLGATHCLDLPLLLGDADAWKQSPMRGKAGDEEWERRGAAVRRAWGMFARDGKMPDNLEGTEIGAA
ncbi:hypothetical protein LTR53_013166 [Teratosphaeriaceae sp. CCFEE 6253]|nr:hypothetical protein LTR53_013166 [Teratosphaeriaceae sp. CCFEE 6253]